MILGNDLELQVYEPEHIQRVLAEIEGNFGTYFQSLAQRPLEHLFAEYIKGYEKARPAYREFMNMEALEEFGHDPGAFKGHTRKRGPVIHKALYAQAEEMNSFRESFARATGRQLLDAVRNIARFEVMYFANFDDQAHEAAATYSDLGLEPLNEGEYGCGGVIGYGIQSSLLHGLRSRCFALRSQNAVWSLYFLSGGKDFGLLDGSEFMMVQSKQGTCEQNYFYPAELFGFYALRVYLLLKAACEDLGVTFDRDYRYTYLAAFCNHVADTHRDDINAFRRSSEDVERQRGY